MWWYRFLFFLMDTTVVNIWKLHHHQSLSLGTKTLSYESFQLCLTKVWASHHLRSRKYTSPFNRHEAVLHMPMWNHLAKMLWLSYMVPNILPMLPWAPHPHWKMLEGGSSSHFYWKYNFLYAKVRNIHSYI